MTTKRAFLIPLLSGTVALALLAMIPAAAGAGEKEAGPTIAAPPCEPGKTSDEIKVPGTQWSYFVYVPKAYAADRKWPVMFIMSPGGGDAGMLQRYVDGAEMNNWILAGSVQSKNEFDQSEVAVKAMVTDVCKKLPVDMRRLYASGFSGGARMSFWLAEDMKAKAFAGVLACAAGGHSERLSPRTTIYGLSGTNCFNRWDMACTLRDTKNDLSRLRFFAGGHDWADTVYLTYGMTWLNACYLKTAAAGNPGLTEEKKQLLAKIAAEIAKETEANPEKAYDWAVCQGLFYASPAAAGNESLQALLKNPKVQLYVAGYKDMGQFVKKVFATNAQDYKTNNGPLTAKREADRLAKKYADTSLAELFTKMGEPSIK